MPCKSCSKNKKSDAGYIQHRALDAPPYGATDIMVYEEGNVRRFTQAEWDNGRHKLILFFPETFTPVCATEMGNLDAWIEAFDDLGVDVYGATTDPIHAVQDWYNSEPLLKDSRYRVLSSYILPSRLGIVNAGRVKRASVFITNDGDQIIQEHFLKVGRSIKELHRTYFAWTTGSYCAEGWKDPSEGFLQDNA